MAATGLGVAAALLPASGAAAETDRYLSTREEVTYRETDGSLVKCLVRASLEWTFGGDGPEDDRLSASTSVWSNFDDPNASNWCEFSQSSVTLRWNMLDYLWGANHTYTGEGGDYVQITAPPPGTYSDGYTRVSSEHRVVLAECSSGCVWTHTFSPK
jgi:hypothetical protein